MSELEQVIKEYAAMWAGTGIFFSDTASKSYARLLGKYEKPIVMKALNRALKESPERPMSAPALKYVCEDIKRGQEIRKALPPPSEEPEPPPLPADSPFARLEEEWKNNPPRREDNPARRIVEMLSAKAEF